MTRTRGEGGGGELCDLGSGGRVGAWTRREEEEEEEEEEDCWVLYGKRRDDVEVCNCVVSVLCNVTCMRVEF